MRGRYLGLYRREGVGLCPESREERDLVRCHSWTREEEEGKGKETLMTRSHRLVTGGVGPGCQSKENGGQCPRGLPGQPPRARPVIQYEESWAERGGEGWHAVGPEPGLGNGLDRGRKKGAGMESWAANGERRVWAFGPGRGRRGFVFLFFYFPFFYSKAIFKTVLKITLNYF